MTQEEKLEEAKRLYKDANADQRYMLEKLFPELKESEDERLIGEKTTWSKEDEYRLSILEALCDDQINSSASYSTMYREMHELKDWLKLLKNRVQPKQEWSEEDEDMCYKVTAVINRLCAENKEYVWSVNTLKTLFYWLKSIKERVGNFNDGYKAGFSAAKHNQWKPSDKQMHYLSWIANIKLGDSVVEQEVSKHLNELLEDLKKLKD